MSDLKVPHWSGRPTLLGVAYLQQLLLRKSQVYVPAHAMAHSVSRTEEHTLGCCLLPASVHLCQRRADTTVCKNNMYGCIWQRPGRQVLWLPVFTCSCR